jgi:iduronate 2-sulfatase
MLRLLWFALLCGLAVSAVQRNLLIMIADDARGTSLSETSLTPNLDKLRVKGTTFTNAYADVPVCGPSRSVIFSGRRSLETGVYTNGMTTNSALPVTTKLAENLKKRGYNRYSFGKTSHTTAKDDNITDSDQNWEIVVPRLQNLHDGYMTTNCDVPNNSKWAKFRNESGAPLIALGQQYQCNMTNDINKQDDVYLANKVAAFLLNYTSTKPLALFVGWQRPHFGNAVHAQFWAKFETDLSRTTSDKIIVSKPVHTTEPENMPYWSTIDLLTNNALTGQNMENPSPAFVQAMRIGYAAALMQMDYSIGIVLDALNKTGMADDTVIIFFGDHGFLLGESTRWKKQLLYDHGLKVDLVITMPGTQEDNVVCDMVSLRDVYPTAITAVTGTQITNEAIAGKSLVGLLKGGGAQCAGQAFSTMHRCDDTQCANYDFTALGVSVRTKNWRYTAWFAVNGTNSYPIAFNSTYLLDEELYDKVAEGDEDHYNLAYNPDYAGIKAQKLALIETEFSI